jgi:uracil-DNA glycosylase
MSEIKEKLSAEQIRDKLIEKLGPSGWSEFLRGFLRSSDFDQIVQFLMQENEEGRRFTPALKQLFTAFERCPVDSVKVVVIGQDPYPQPLVADGMAFSCGNLLKPEASLRYMLRAIESTVPIEQRQEVTDTTKCDLGRWASQGVLLLNTALTTEVTKTGKHTHIWKPFMEYVIDMLNFRQSGLIWVLMGKQAQSFDSIIGEHHKVLTCAHPAFAAYQRLHEWDCNDVFNKVNSQLTEFKKDIIYW